MIFIAGLSIGFIGCVMLMCLLSIAADDHTNTEGRNHD